MSYEDLMQFARNDMDVECLTLLSEGNTQKDVARVLGRSQRSIEKRLQRIRSIAAVRGFSPEHDMRKVTAEGFLVKGTSTLYDENGDQRLQWVKTSKSQEEVIELMQAIVDGMKEDITPCKPSFCPQLTDHLDEKLLNLHVISDYHLGMMAMGEESEEDWDLSKAEDLFMKWVDYSVHKSPDAEVGVLCNLGDFLHTNGLVPTTPASGNVLDVSARFHDIVRTSIRCLRYAMDVMLSKYLHVHFISADANHDPDAGIWLREMFAQLYMFDPRVSVDCSASTYTMYEHGLTSLFFHHGHKKKIKDVDSVFVSEYREVFGRTKYSYAHVGHLHHVEVKESNLMITEQHRTMSPSDAYASTHGYCSGRSAPVISYHKDFGEVSRLTVTPQMLR